MLSRSPRISRTGLELVLSYQHWNAYRAAYLPVVPGQAGGGSFQKEKNYIAQKEFAYRMCARRPTSAMPKSFLCCERAFCRSMVVMFCALKWSVLMSWCLLRGQVMWWSRHLMRCNGLCCVMSRDAIRCHGDELCYSSTTLYYKVLLQYYSVLQILLCTTPVLPCTTKYYSSTTPVLPCTTKYYSSTNLYYKVLLQYYSVLQCTTPILPCTTKYYSSTTLQYKVLLQYYSVLQSTTPILFRTTNTTLYYSSTTLYYKVPLKYYSALLQYYLVLQSTTRVPQSTSWLIHITYETSFTMRGATVNTLQPHQVLRLPRKMNLMIDPHHIWNVIYNARSNRHHPATSPNTAPATQNESHDWSASHMQRHLQCAEQQASPSNLTKYCACHAKWMPWLIVLTSETSFPMRRAAKVTLPLHQVLRLPRKMNVMIDPAHVWNVIYNARSNRYQPATSPNTAPATQNCIP